MGMAPIGFVLKLGSRTPDYGRFLEEFFAHFFGRFLGWC
jgi:hypothetical protein